MDSSRWGALGMMVAGVLGIGAVAVGASPARPAPRAHERSDIDRPGPATLASRPPNGAQDFYRCFEARGCPGPALSSSTTCLAGRDYAVTVATRDESDVSVLSFHGGRIEPGSSPVSAMLAQRYGWNRYDLNAHGTPTCLDGRTNATRLHITSDHFDDPRAVALVGRHHRAVSIHGYDRNRGLSRGTICVGGRDDVAVVRFISSLGRNKARFRGYDLVGLDSRWVLAADGCTGLTGMGETNIVNRTAGGRGGLQLELVAGMKFDLANPSASFDGLRAAFFAAVHDAMTR